MNGFSEDNQRDRPQSNDAPLRLRFTLLVRSWASPSSLAIVHRVSGIGSIALALAAVGLVFYFSHSWTDDGSYRTDVGGFQRVPLSDGSIIELNTDTRMVVQFRPESRQVELLQGEALFTVAKDVKRPFDVMADGTTVRAVGTAFTVRLYEPGHVNVLVTEGAVKVSNRHPTKTPASAADQIERTYDVPAGLSADIMGEDVAIARSGEMEESKRLAWREGWLKFEGDSLTEVVDSFNRYNRQKLVIGDPEIAGMQIGGQFPTTGVEAFLEAWTGQGRFGMQGRAVRRESGGSGSGVVVLYGPAGRE